MSVTVETTIAGPFIPNGATTVFAFDFKAAAASEVSVYQGDLEPGSLVDPALYDVALSTTSDGGTISFTDPPLVGSGDIYILSAPSFQQGAGYSSGESAFTPKSLNPQFDRTVVRDLWLRSRLELLTTTAMVLPDARKGKFLAWTASGDPYPSSGTGADAGLREDLAEDGVPLIGGLDDALDARPITLPTIAAMVAIPKAQLTNAQLVNVLCHSTPFDGGGGTFYWHATAPTTEDGGTVFASVSGGNGRWLRDFKGAVSPTWFGAKGDDVTDDTASFQASLNGLVNLAVTVPYGKYRVSHLKMDLLGRVFDGGGAVIDSNATTEQTSLISLSGGVGYYRDLRLAVLYNPNYECGLHWHTPRLDQPERGYPGYLDLVNCQVEGAPIGLMIGALPSQAVIGDQDDVMDDGEAIDAPLSESLITGFRATNCAIACYMRQPNGKVSLVGPRLLSEIDDWTGGYEAPERSAAVVVAHEGSELSVLGGEMLHVQGGDNGSLFTVTAGRLNAIGTVVETTVPAFIDGHSYVYLDHIQNFGVNLVNPDRPLFEIGPDFDGTLSVANCRILYPAGNAGSHNGELAKSVSALGGSFAPNPATIVNFENCEFRDAVWRMGSTYRPIARGVRVSFIQCQLTAYDGSGNRTLLQRLEDGPNLLAGAIDRAFKTVPAYPQTADGSGGGWTFDVTGAGSQWGNDTTGLPEIEDLDVYAWLRLKAGGSGTTTAETAKFRCKPSKAHILRGFIKTGGTSASLSIRAKFWDFAGATLDAGAEEGTKSFDMFNGPQLEFGSAIQPVIFYFIPPSDADQCSLEIEVRNGAECYVALLEVG